MKKRDIQKGRAGSRFGGVGGVGHLFRDEKWEWERGGWEMWGGVNLIWGVAAKKAGNFAGGAKKRHTIKKKFQTHETVSGVIFGGFAAIFLMIAFAYQRGYLK
jgi:hypothetical protein